MYINYWWQLSLLVIVCYFVGNFCAAIFLSSKFIKKDIRGLGSKNAGTTNMLRVFGIKYGIATFFIDFLKGYICVFGSKMIFTLIGGNEVGLFAAYLAGLSVILGHNYPILLGLKGGKGFASGIGVFMAVSPVVTLILLFIGVILLLIVDRMSVFALTFFAAEAIYHLVIYSDGLWWTALFASVYFILSVISHWPNILRLVKGEEKPLGLIDRLKSGRN